MGQYYKPITIDKDNNLTVYSLQLDDFSNSKNYDLYNGIKLMEHSWIGNFFTDFFSFLIYKNPLSVAWVGDYSLDEKNPKLSIDFYDKIWNKNSKDLDVPKKRAFIYKNKFLVNHTKKCYFSLNPYIRKEDSWIIYPISLMTAVGNGLGGGDYFGTNQELVGTWAFDIISIECKVPKEYTLMETPIFEEN